MSNALLQEFLALFCYTTHLPLFYRIVLGDLKQNTSSQMQITSFISLMCFSLGLLWVNIKHPPYFKSSPIKFILPFLEQIFHPTL